MAKVIYAPEADNDIVGIVDFIARDKPEAARNWMLKIRETCDTIATQPGMGEERPGFDVNGCRSLSVGSYVVFFRAIEDGIEVSRVIHGSRDMRNI
ncbi:type II toxin-antitoxin system RelE/ParE family toxin [Rhodopirellula bahusiensis]|uniref:type II toxin-antitoxin system RelE/ParE family toxin n=1 Tax=Rhodopirellula bahusiensis TaxID=2014065 RepID=UPI0032660C77